MTDLTQLPYSPYMWGKCLFLTIILLHSPQAFPIRKCAPHLRIIINQQHYLCLLDIGALKRSVSNGDFSIADIYGIPSPYPFYRFNLTKAKARKYSKVDLRLYLAIDQLTSERINSVHENNFMLSNLLPSYQAHQKLIMLQESTYWGLADFFFAAIQFIHKPPSRADARKFIQKHLAFAQQGCALRGNASNSRAIDSNLSLILHTIFEYAEEMYQKEGVQSFAEGNLR